MKGYIRFEGTLNKQKLEYKFTLLFVYGTLQLKFKHELYMTKFT